MNPLPASVGAPALPQVSLIPPEFARRSHRAQLRAASVIVLLVAVGITVVWWFFALGIRTVADSALATEQDKRGDLTKELATYQYVRDAQTAHNRAVDAQDWASSTDVRWDAYLVKIFDVLPEGVNLNQIQVQQVTPAAGGLVKDDSPFSQPNLGSITIQATALDPSYANDLIHALSPISGVIDVEMTDIHLESIPDVKVPVWTFTLIANVSLDALSNRTIITEEPAS